MANTFYKGDEAILYLVVNDIDCPIACLTTNDFSEISEVIDTTTTDNNGWKTSKPTNQSYTITFGGLQVITQQAIPTAYSLDNLQTLKRARTLVDWKIKTEGVFEQTGSGYIVELSEAAPVNDYLSFTGTILGYGEPTVVDITDDVYQFENNDVYIFED